MIITISRQAATNGGLIGQLVADRLGLRVFDRELVDEMARRLHVDPELVRTFDEVLVKPIDAIILEWRTSINEAVYGRLLRQVLQEIAQAPGPGAVIIGRGATNVLKGPSVLNVRLVAPRELRAGIYAALHGVTLAAAHRRIRHLDAERAQFVRAIFHRDIDDPTQYDLVLNLTEFSPECAAELIARAALINAAAGLPAEVHDALPRHVALLSRHRRPTLPGMVEETRKIG